MNDCELNVKMSDEEIERIKELLTKDVKVVHYLLKIDNDKELDVVEYKEYEILEKRINKAIDVLNRYIIFSSEDRQKYNEKIVRKTLSILQDKEVKDNA